MSAASAFNLHENEMVCEVPIYPAAPKPVPSLATEPPVEVNAPPLTYLETWANLTFDGARDQNSPMQTPSPRRTPAPKSKKP
jgi:hypothetical protein